MIYVLTGLPLKGPLNTEQRFKKAMLAYSRMEHPDSYHFEVENTEKEPGMPDVLIINKHTNVAKFWEFKVADGRGLVKFEPTQPLWYAQHPKLSTIVIAYLPAQKKVFYITADEIVRMKTRKILLLGGEFGDTIDAVR